MKKTNLLLVTLLYFIGAVQILSAQEKHRFWDDVQTIKKYDAMYTPPKNPVLFVGSSSIRKWTDAERTFAKYDVMNRGIGGAVVNDIIYYADDLVFNYHPRQIVIYVGENDLVDSSSTADSISNRTKRLVSLIRSKLPEIPLVYISIKPSPVRERVIEKAKLANSLIKPFIEAQKKAVYVDVFS